MVGVNDKRTEAERARIRIEHLRDQRPASSARGVHHVALVCADVERTVTFYQDLLEFPLTEIVDDRDHQGANRFFFDVGNGNLLAFVDLPGLDLGPDVAVLGGLHHITLSVTPQRWQRLRDKLDAVGVPYRANGEVSLYFRDPDGAPLELLAHPLGEMCGLQLL